MTFPSGSVAIVGVYESPRRRAPGMHPFYIQAEVVAGALKDAGIEPHEVDGFATAAGLATESAWQFATAELAEYLGITPKWMDNSDVGGPATLSQITHAVAAINAGLCETVVISYGALGRSSLLPMPDYNSGHDGPGQWEVPYGLSTITAYALAAQRHMHEFGTKPEHFAQISVQARANAASNPDAMYRDPITVDDVLNSALLSSPLHKFDCCVVSDSGGAIVLTSAKRAAQFTKQPVYVLGGGEAIGQIQMNQMHDMTKTAAQRSARDAFERAGITHDEVDVAQLYDSFTVTVLLALENLGFVGPGEAGAFIEDGNLAPTGSLPFNTDGGGLSSNHPGRRGTLATIEAVRQLQGRSPGVQLDNPKIALVNGTGANLSTNSTLILGV
ncbi:MAG: hypothetical protein EPO52_15410 [Herbiconiux sp.]|uniref:thiolase C-terminal domain-containing protein n=1 Tax=Herbiconiux sp. TaxID=1871186 RepID=UPI00122010DF|nr:thiolase domain-containing protein [Herbiconiux sp.]TAJ46916.1 MAG: hypothetical protein EPO52_15410 [Herbiconiux sp.]